MAGLSASALFHLFSTGDRSDFTITCQEQDFKVHKVVICAGSHFFDAITKGNFREDSVELKETSQAALTRVLHFFYLGDHHEDDDTCSSNLHKSRLTSGANLATEIPTRSFAVWKSRSKVDNELAGRCAKVNLDVYQLADMWGIEWLKRLAAIKVLTNMEAMDSDTIVRTVASAYDITTPDDNVFRPAVMDMCFADYVGITKGWLHLLSLLEQHDSVTWRAATKIARAVDQKKDREIAALQAAHKNNVAVIEEGYDQRLKNMVDASGKQKWAMSGENSPYGEERVKWVVEGFRWANGEEKVNIRCETCGSF